MGEATEWRRRVRTRPTDVVARLRLADALALSGDAAGAASLREDLADGAALGGRPLPALAALLAAGAGPTAAERLAGYLAGSPRLSRAPRPPSLDEPLADAPLEVEDGPVPGFPRDAAPDLLPRLPLVSHLDAAAFADLVPTMSRRALAPGEVLLAEGDPADAVYLVAGGTLEVTRSDPDRHPVVLGRVGEGALLGEMALVLARPRTASVTAVSDSEVVRVDLPAVQALATRRPLVQAALADFTRQRLRAMLVATSPLFRDLEPPARAALLTHFAFREVPEGLLIVEQGEPASALRVVVAGEVEVLRSENGAAPVRIARLGAGQVFGEIALLTGQPSTATVVATTETALLELHRPAIDDVCRDHPGIAEALTRIGMERLAENRFIFADDDFIEEAE